MARVAEWRALGASEYLSRAIQFGIYEPPTRPFTSGTLAPELAQSPEERAFG